MLSCEELDRVRGEDSPVRRGLLHVAFGNRMYRARCIVEPIHMGPSRVVDWHFVCSRLLVCGMNVFVIRSGSLDKVVIRTSYIFRFFQHDEDSM